LDITRVRKKLAEARFFLGHMNEQEGRLLGDREPFNFYLSAFLSAGRSVGFCYPERQRKAWEKAALSPDEQRLIKFMVEDRDREVHASGSHRTVAQESVPLPMGTSHLDGATIFIAGPPGMPPTVATKPTYNFAIDGTEGKATEVCAEYLSLLQQMVEEFEGATAQT
jgi:hypothetical protein